MKPILFDETATSFTTNGIGRLDCVSCVVTEERNGQYELEMEISTESQYANNIKMNSIIVVQPAVDSSLQAFRVYDIEKLINGMFMIHANHISYQLNLVTVMPFSVSASSGACASTLSQLKSNAVGSISDFNFSTDVTTVASYTQIVPQVLRKCLGGMQGSVLDQFGGEFEFNNYNVILHKHRGIQTPNVILRYGKDITDISQEENIAETITGIVPYWTDYDGSELVILPERVIESSYASQYPFKRTIPMDFSNDFKEKPTQNELRVHAQAYINKAGIGVPKVSIKVSFIDLSQTEEYKDLLSLQSIKLCDTVGVYFDSLDINTTAEIVKTVYDCLKERYESIEIGSLRSNLVDVITNTNSAISVLANDTTTNFDKMTNNIQESIDNATAWLTSSNGYVIAVKNTDGSWKELIFADDNDPARWHNLLRINENGLGFSSDGGSTYKQGWTLDGRILIGGSNATSLTVYKQVGGVDTVLFEVTPNHIVWDAPNSSMNSSGTITARNANLQGTLKTAIDGVSGYYVKVSEKGIQIIDETYDDVMGGLKFNSNSVTLESEDYITVKSNDSATVKSYNVLLECSILSVADEGGAEKEGLDETVSIEDGYGSTVELEFSHGILVDVNYT